MYDSFPPFPSIFITLAFCTHVVLCNGFGSGLSGTLKRKYNPGAVGGSELNVAISLGRHCHRY